MIYEVNKIKKENERLKKESEIKYFENRVIDTELEYIKHLQEMKKNNFYITVIGSLVIFLSVYFCEYQYFDLNKITEISLLFGNSACALLAGSRFANVINNKILKELNLNNDSVNIKENELMIKKEINNKLLNNINNKLIKNSDILDYLEVTDNNVIGNESNNNSKKLVLKKIV